MLGACAYIVTDNAVPLKTKYVTRERKREGDGNFMPYSGTTRVIRLVELTSV